MSTNLTSWHFRKSIPGEFCITLCARGGFACCVRCLVVIVRSLHKIIGPWIDVQRGQGAILTISGCSLWQGDPEPSTSAVLGTGSVERPWPNWPSMVQQVSMSEASHVWIHGWIHVWLQHFHPSTKSTRASYRLWVPLQLAEQNYEDVLSQTSLSCERNRTWNLSWTWISRVKIWKRYFIPCIVFKIYIYINPFKYSNVFYRNISDMILHRAFFDRIFFMTLPAQHDDSVPTIWAPQVLLGSKGAGSAAAKVNACGSLGVPRDSAGGELRTGLW